MTVRSIIYAKESSECIGNMTMPIDLITHKKLVIVKQLYQQATIHSSSFSISSKIIALICFDCSIETILKAVIGFLNTTKTPADSFQSVVDQCEDLMSKAGLGPIPDKANIQHIHSLRNDAQHKAKYPNDSDISDCHTYTRDFHNKLLNQLWGTSIEKISLTELIQHAEVKKFLADAEVALSTRSYVESVEHASAGLSKTLALVESAIVGRISISTDAFVMYNGPNRKLEPDRGILRTFKRMQEVLLYVSLGINYANYMQYHQIAGYTLFTADGEHHQHGIKQPLEPNDAEFVVAYCIDTITKIESQVGNLDAPFGKGYWL